MPKWSRADEALEDKNLAFRELVERAYKTAPSKTDSELVYMGYWRIATQLKVDHEAGRL